MNLLHKTLNEQVLPITFPGVNFTHKSSTLLFKNKDFKK